MYTRLTATRKVAFSSRREAPSPLPSSQPSAPNPATEPTSTALSGTRRLSVPELSHESHPKAQISSEMGSVLHELQSFREALSIIFALREQMLEDSSLRQDLDALQDQANRQTTVAFPEQ
ncbi:unnamed protein product [Agarophyton chilense]|eukprot:gb/GEZJ01002739.1/.p1 GENE.gb/GEZJ01002739.1/~~gb/GEZJ01002739.1/.p1  ORF type:complete len:120 (-),score=12.09 gb/GEZJ01002739.1/:589-948(-)